MIKLWINCLLVLLLSFKAQAIITKVTPPGSINYGMVYILPNGNYVIVDAGADQYKGAVYLYHGQTHALISKLTGSQPNDQIGYGGITVLSNNNFIVLSPYWMNGTKFRAGAVTLVNGVTGLNGQVSVNNSLVGSDSMDNVGSRLTVLSNGHVVIVSPFWHNGSIHRVGAVTWFNGNTGLIGLVDSNNSLIGSTNNIFNANFPEVKALNNGNYVVSNYTWDNGNLIDVGAVTWGNGNGGTHGMISPNNSLVGNTMHDLVGTSVTTLSNGNYVVSSRYYDHGPIVNTGAITFGSGITGISGIVNAQNSIVGSSTYDELYKVTGLTNGNFIVSCPSWDNGLITDVGLVKWVDGQVGDVGVLNGATCWIGSSTSDQVGKSVYALQNGHAVCVSENWDGVQVANAGAVTWIDGTTMSSGIISASNSIVGNTNGAMMLNRLATLNNGHFVIAMRQFSIGNSPIGAVMWCNGYAPTVGAVDTANCLYGSANGDFAGCVIVPLNNGHYVVSNINWNNNLITSAGAVTWCNGNGGTTGPINSSNSIVGYSQNDNVGEKVYALKNGNYVICSSNWKNGTQSSAGACTWANGNTGITGAVSAANSLVGTYWNDRVGGIVFELNDSNYVVFSPYYNGIIYSGGAFTWSNGQGGLLGTVNSSNSLLGTVTDQFSYFVNFTNYGNGAYGFACYDWNGIGFVSWSKSNGEYIGNLNNCRIIYGTALFGNSVPQYNPIYNYLIISVPYENKVYIAYPGSPESITNVQGCGSYYFNDQTLTSSGLYLDTLLNAQGCDSVFGVQLTINNPTTCSINITSCNSYNFFGQTLTNSGVYYYTLLNSIGCDSLITLNLTIINSETNTISAKACNSYIFNGQTLTHSGTYYDTLLNSVGCDTFITLNLMINKPSTSTSSVTAYNSYTFNGQTLTKSGVYYDTLFNVYGCDSLIVLNLTIDSNEFYVYPSPTNALVWVYAVNGFKQADIRLMHSDGKLISEYKQVQGSKYSFDLSSLASGLYLIQCVDESGVYFRKVMKY